LRKLILVTAGLGVTFGIAVDQPIFFGNVVAILFMMLIVWVLVGFCVSISEADWVHRAWEPEESERNKHELSLTRSFKKIERYGW